MFPVPCLQSQSPSWLCLALSCPCRGPVAWRVVADHAPVLSPSPPPPLRTCTYSYLHTILLSHPHSPFCIPSPPLLPTARLSLTARKEDSHTRYRDGTPSVTLCTPRGPCSLLAAAASQPPATPQHTKSMTSHFLFFFFSLHFQSRPPWLLSHPIKLSRATYRLSSVGLALVSPQSMSPACHAGNGGVWFRLSGVSLFVVRCVWSGLWAVYRTISTLPTRAGYTVRDVCIHIRCHCSRCSGRVHYVYVVPVPVPPGQRCSFGQAQVVRLWVSVRGACG